MLKITGENSVHKMVSELKSLSEETLGNVDEVGTSVLNKSANQRSQQTHVLATGARGQGLTHVRAT